MILKSGVSRNSIRLRRVLLLRSDIRHTPSGIRFASFKANRISLSPKDLISLYFLKYLALGEEFSKENITLTIVSISLDIQKEREDSSKNESSLFCCLVDLGYCPTAFVLTNAMPVLNRKRYDYKFSDKNNTYFSAQFFYFL